MIAEWLLHLSTKKVIWVQSSEETGSIFLTSSTMRSTMPCKNGYHTLIRIFSQLAGKVSKGHTPFHNEERKWPPHLIILWPRTREGTNTSYPKDCICQGTSLTSYIKIKFSIIQGEMIFLKFICRCFFQDIIINTRFCQLFVIF